MSYVLFTLVPLLLSFVVACTATLLWRQAIPSSGGYFLISTLSTLGLHALLTAMVEALRILNPVPQAIYGVSRAASNASDFQYFMGLFSTERVVVLAATAVLAAPTLWFLKLLVARSGAV
jgi:hypothetical protein